MARGLWIASLPTLLLCLLVASCSASFMAKPRAAAKRRSPALRPAVSVSVAASKIDQLLREAEAAEAAAVEAERAYDTAAAKVSAAAQAKEHATAVAGRRRECGPHAEPHKNICA